jgi:hypothetical protein
MLGHLLFTAPILINTKNHIVVFNRAFRVAFTVNMIYFAVRNPKLVCIKFLKCVGVVKIYYKIGINIFYYSVNLNSRRNFLPRNKAKEIERTFRDYVLK